MTTVSAVEFSGERRRLRKLNLYHPHDPYDPYNNVERYSYGELAETTHSLGQVRELLLGATGVQLGDRLVRLLGLDKAYDFILLDGKYERSSVFLGRPKPVGVLEGPGDWVRDATTSIVVQRHPKRLGDVSYHPSRLQVAGIEESTGWPVAVSYDLLGVKNLDMGGSLLGVDIGIPKSVDDEPANIRGDWYEIPTNLAEWRTAGLITGGMVPDPLRFLKAKGVRRLGVELGTVTGFVKAQPVDLDTVGIIIGPYGDRGEDAVFQTIQIQVPNSPGIS